GPASPRFPSSASRCIPDFHAPAASTASRATAHHRPHAPQSASPFSRSISRLAPRASAPPHVPAPLLPKPAHTALNIKSPRCVAIPFALPSSRLYRFPKHKLRQRNPNTVPPAPHFLQVAMV